MKKQLLFIILIFVGFVGAYGQNYTAVGSATATGTINDIYVAKVPDSATDSIYLSVQGIGVQTTQISLSSTSTFRSRVFNNNDNLKIRIEDFFNSGKPDLMVSHFEVASTPKLDSTHFNFYKSLSQITSTHKRLQVKEAGTIKWRKVFNDTTMYLLFNTQSGSNEYAGLYQFGTSGLTEKVKMGDYKYGEVMGEFVNVKNDGTIDVVETGALSDNTAVADRYTNFTLKSSGDIYNSGSNNTFKGIVSGGSNNVYGYLPGKIITGDIDGDGWEDIVILGEEKSSIATTVRTMSFSSAGTTKKIIWFRNDNGSGTFIKQENEITNISDIANSDFVLGDFNYDGKVDICVADNGSLKIFTNDGNGNFTNSTPISFGTTGQQHRIGLYVNTSAIGNKRLEIFVSNQKTLYRFTHSYPTFNFRAPRSLSISSNNPRLEDDETTIGHDITVAWSKVDAAVSYDGFMELKSADGSRKKVLLHKSIPLAIHGNLGNGNIEGDIITDTKKAKFFIPQDVYMQYVGGTATMCVWSVDGAYRRSLDSAVISIIIPPVTQSPDPLPPTDSICPNCPTSPDNPNNVYRRPRVRMVSGNSQITATNIIEVTLKSLLTATGWTRPLTNAGFYFSTDSLTLTTLTFGGTNQRNLPATIIPNPITSGLILDSVNVSATYRDSLNLLRLITGRNSFRSGTKYFVRAFAVNIAGPVFSNKNNIKSFTTARQAGTVDPELPDTELPGTEGEDDNGTITPTPLPDLTNGDIPIFYKRLPQAYPYRIMKDTITVNGVKSPVILDFKVANSLGTDYGQWIKDNKTIQAGDSVVLQTLKIKPDGLTGIEVTARGYTISNTLATRTLKIFPKYRLQQHFLPNSSTEDGCTVMIRRGITHSTSDQDKSSSRTDTLNIIVNNSNINLIPNRQKSIALSSWVVSSSYAKIHSAFPTVDTSYLDAVAPSSTQYTFNTVTENGILGRFNIDNAGNFKFLPKDTTFTISAANDGNDFFKALNDSLYIRIRLSHNIVEFPDPPGGSFDDDTVTVVVPDRNGRDSTVRVTGFPTDGIRVFYQTSDYRLPTETVAVITTTIRNSDSTVRTDTIRRPIQFKRGQTVAAGAKFRMNGLAIRMDSINTGFYHSNPQRIVYKHRDSVWIETTGGTPIIQRRVPLYIIPKQIYDYKVIQTVPPTFVYPTTTTGSDSYNIVGDTINILKRSSATSGTSTMTINFKYNTSVFSQDQLKHLYSPTTNIHQSKTPKLFGTDEGNRISSITPSTDAAASDRLAITYSNTTTTETATDGKVKLTGDSITFFKKTARNLVLRIRKFDSIPNSTLDGILMTGSVLDWCTQSLSDSIHRPTGSTTPTVLKSTTIAGRIVNFEVLPQYRHIIQLKPAVPAVSDNMEARNIKMLDTGQVVIRAYVNDNGDLPALEQLLRFRVVACPAAINNTDIDWIKPGVIDTVFSTLFRDEFELKAIVRQFPQGAVRYEITEGFEDGRILSGNRLKLQGTLGEISIKASYAGSVFYRPSEKLLQVTTDFIKSRQIVKEQPNIPTNFISHSTIRAHSELTVQNFELKKLIAVRDSITNRDLTTNAKLRATIEPVPINGRVIQGFPRPGDPTINYDTTLFHYEKPVGVPVKLTIWAKEDTLYYESQPYYKNILIIGDTQNPSLILPEYPGKDCFDIKAELKKHYVGEFEYADVMIYNRYGSNVMNLTAKAAEENCLYDVQKLKDGVYLCVLYVDGNRAQPYCSYITIVRSK